MWIFSRYSDTQLPTNLICKKTRSMEYMVTWRFTFIMDSATRTKWDDKTKLVYRIWFSLQNV